MLSPFLSHLVPTNKRLSIHLIIPRTTEWFGLEGTLKTIWFQPPAMGRDTSHQPRLPKALSSLALGTSRVRRCSIHQMVYEFLCKHTDNFVSGYTTTVQGTVCNNNNKIHFKSLGVQVCLWIERSVSQLFHLTSKTFYSNDTCCDDLFTVFVPPKNINK